MTIKNTSALRIGFACIIAVLYDVLFYNHDWGINLPLFIILIILGLAVMSSFTKETRNEWAWLLAIPTIVLSLSTGLYSNEMSTFASPLLAILGLLVTSMVLTIQTNDLPLYLNQLALPRHLDSIIGNWKNIYQDLFTGNGGQGKRILWGFVIAFPLLIIFASLLSEADLIFAQWLEDLNIWEGIWRIFRTVILTLLIGGFFYLLGSDKNSLVEKTSRVIKMNPTTVGVVLILLNALFVLFVYIQIKYLFGGASYVLANNITLAEYARNGFFDLVKVVGVAAVLIILVQRSFSHHGSHTFVNGMQVLFIGQIGIVAASALRRMSLYQEAYGFTTLRLYVEWFIYVLIAALIFSGIALLFKIKFRYFFQSLVFAAFITVAVVSLINVDYTIARENIGRFLHEKKDLDTDYLSQLSRDATPAYSELVKLENFEKLTITQKLALDTVWDAYSKKNASSTFFSHTWSEKTSRDFLVTIPPDVRSSIQRAKEKDERYEKQFIEIKKNVVYQNHCLTGSHANPEGSITGSVGILCTYLMDNEKEILQAQLITYMKEGTTNTKPNSKHWLYAVVHSVKSTSQTTALYSRELPEFDDTVLNFERKYIINPNEYILRNNGDVIGSDYDERNWYVYSLINNNGYQLADKKLY